MNEEQLKNLRTRLNLPDTADEATVIAAAVAAIPNPVTAPAPPATQTTNTTNPSTATLQTIGASDRETLIALAEENPTVKRLVEGFTALQAAQKLSEVNLRLNEWSTTAAGRKWGLPSVAQEKLKTIMLSDAPTTTQLAEVIDKILEVGLVKLSSSGYGPSGTAEKNYSDATAEVDSRARKLMESDKALDYGAAVTRVCEEDEALARDYFLVG